MRWSVIYLCLIYSRKYLDNTDDTFLVRRLTNLSVFFFSRSALLFFYPVWLKMHVRTSRFLLHIFAQQRAYYRLSWKRLPFMQVFFPSRIIEFEKAKLSRKKMSKCMLSKGEFHHRSIRR